MKLENSSPENTDNEDNDQMQTKNMKNTDIEAFKAIYKTIYNQINKYEENDDFKGKVFSEAKVFRKLIMFFLPISLTVSKSIYLEVLEVDTLFTVLKIELNQQKNAPVFISKFLPTGLTST